MTTALNFSNLVLSYQLILQRVNAQGQILSTIPNDVQIDLPNGVSGEQVYNVPAGSVDYSLAIAQGDFTDFVVIWSNEAISYKLDSTAGSPIRLRAGGLHLLDSSNIQGVFISNPTVRNAQVLFFQSREVVIPPAA